MNTNKHYLKRTLWISSIMLTALVTGCNSDSDSSNSGPTVISTNPADGDKAAPLNHKVIATFSEAMDATTIDTQSFSVKAAGEQALSGDFNVDAASHTASFKPIDGFTDSTDYTATLTTAIKSTAGSIALTENKVWHFTSGTAADTTAPMVSSTTPIKDAPNVAPNRPVTANFNEAIDPATVNKATFTLKDGTTEVPGVVSYSDKVATFTPTKNLIGGTEYTATLTAGITDLAGKSLAALPANEWSFTAGSIIAGGPKPVNLGTAGDFVILSKTAITDVPSSYITGNIGLSPESSTFIGVNCTAMQLSGITIYGVDPGYADKTCFEGGTVASGGVTAKKRVDDAILDMRTAYNDAFGRTNPDATELNAGEIGGTTIAPGLYKWSSNVLIKTSTVLTLSGGANDVWIFQIAGDLKLEDFAEIKLAGQAKAKNVFWQVGGGSSVTLNKGTHFEGVALAAKGISLVTDATVKGRLLAHTKISLQKNNTITQPAK